MAKHAIQMSENDNTFLFPKYRLFQYPMKPATCGWCRCEVITGQGFTPTPPSWCGRSPVFPGLWRRLSMHSWQWCWLRKGKHIPRIRVYPWRRNGWLSQDGEIPYSQLAAKSGWLIPSRIVLFWGFRAGFWCQQVGFLMAAVARLASFSGVHALALTHSFCFCHHVHSVYMSITCALGNGWQRLANVKSFCLLVVQDFYLGRCFLVSIHM